MVIMQSVGLQGNCMSLGAFPHDALTLDFDVLRL